MMIEEQKHKLPPGWVMTDIESLSEGVISGSGFPKEFQGNSDGQHPFAKVGDISKVFRENYKTIDSADHYISEEVRRKIKARIFPKGTIVFPKIGEALRGNYRLITAREMIFDNNVMGIIPNKELVHTDYLYYFLRTKDFGKFAVATAVPSVRGRDIGAIEIPLATFNEQLRIVSKIEELFSDLEAAKSNLVRVQKLLIRYRQAVLKDAMTGELIQADNTKWQEVTVGRLLADIRYGTARKCDRDSSKTPVLRIPNVVSGKIDLEDLKYTDFTPSELRNLSLRAGDILLVRSNGSADLVARTSIVSKQAEGFAYAGYLIRLRLNLDLVLPEYLHLFFHSPAVRALVERQARSTSGVHNINSDEIKSLALRLPSLEEQEQIIDRVEDIFSRIDTLEIWCRTELTRSNTLRQAILKAAFSGQLVSQNPIDEPASVLLERISAGRGTIMPKERRPPIEQMELL